MLEVYIRSQICVLHSFVATLVSQMRLVSECSTQSCPLGGSVRLRSVYVCAVFKNRL